MTARRQNFHFDRHTDSCYCGFTVFYMDFLPQGMTRRKLSTMLSTTAVFIGTLTAACIVLFSAPGGAQTSAEQEATRSAPPDTTPYQRPAVPEDYAPSKKPAIRPEPPKERKAPSEIPSDSQAPGPPQNVKPAQ